MNNLNYYLKINKNNFINKIISKLVIKNLFAIYIVLYYKLN